MLQMANENRVLLHGAAMTAAPKLVFYEQTV